MPIFAGLIALFNSAIVKMFVDKLLFFLAIKALLTALFIVVAPIVIKNVIYDIMQIGITMVENNMNTGTYNGYMEFTGFLAWLLDTLRIPQILGILSSALQLHMLLAMIPLSPVKK